MNSILLFQIEAGEGISTAINQLNQEKVILKFGAERLYVLTSEKVLIFRMSRRYKHEYNVHLIIVYHLI